MDRRGYVDQARSLYSFLSDTSLDIAGNTITTLPLGKIRASLARRKIMQGFHARVTTCDTLRGFDSIPCMVFVAAQWGLLPCLSLVVIGEAGWLVHLIAMKSDFNRRVTVLKMTRLATIVGFSSLAFAILLSLIFLDVGFLRFPNRNNRLQILTIKLRFRFSEYRYIIVNPKTLRSASCTNSTQFQLIVPIINNNCHT